MIDGVDERKMKTKQESIHASPQFFFPPLSSFYLTYSFFSPFTPPFLFIVPAWSKLSSLGQQPLKLSMFVCVCVCADMCFVPACFEINVAATVCCLPIDIFCRPTVIPLAASHRHRGPLGSSVVTHFDSLLLAPLSLCSRPF